MEDIVLWGIHGGNTGDAESLLVRGNCVALGWQKMGDLVSLKPSREAFKARVAEIYSGEEGRGDPDRRRPDVPVRPHKPADQPRQGLATGRGGEE